MAAILATERFIQRNCPPGSMARHPDHGMVEVRAADGLQRLIVYVVERIPQPVAPDDPETLYAEDIVWGSGWVHVGTLQRVAPRVDLEAIVPRNWAAIEAQMGRRFDAQNRW